MTRTAFVNGKKYIEKTPNIHCLLNSPVQPNPSIVSVIFYFFFYN